MVTLQTGQQSSVRPTTRPCSQTEIKYSDTIIPEKPIYLFPTNYFLKSATAQLSVRKVYQKSNSRHAWGQKGESKSQNEGMRESESEWFGASDMQPARLCGELPWLGQSQTEPFAPAVCSRALGALHNCGMEVTAGSCRSSSLCQLWL